MIALVLLCSGFDSPASEKPDEMFGFTANSTASQQKIEAQFDALLVGSPFREWMQRITARPHHVGSAYARENAEWMEQQFRSWGFDARIESFPMLLPTPRIRRVELLSPNSYVAKLEEPVLTPSEAKLRTVAEELPPYGAFSIGGDVTAELVYVNYGMPDDFTELERRGIDVKGKITLARFGGGWRGIAPRESAEHGAVGCIMYMDPEDYGWPYGDSYPEGGLYNGWAVERGSITDFSKFGGDPLSIGIGAPASLALPPLEEIKRLPGFITIPVLPIGWNDAQPLIASLKGLISPPEWKGGLPLPYYLGPGPGRVRLQVEFDWKIVETHNVIAVLTGKSEPDRWVIRGNHHDAWVYGAGDPVSAMVALLAEARGIGRLASQGWRPKRTLIYAAWDGEEFGLRGAVEWAETHASELNKKAVAYLNTDGYTRGVFNASGSPILELLVNQVARDVNDPVKNVSVLKRHLATQIVNGAPPRAKAARDGKLWLSPASGGSDHVPFIHHLGIPSLFVLTSGDENAELSHTSYDTVETYERYMDPGFRYGITMAQANGRLAMRLASADVLPFDPLAFAGTMARSIDSVNNKIEELRSEAEEHNRRLADGIFEMTADPNLPFVKPSKLSEVPEFDLTSLTQASERLQEAAKNYHERIQEALDNQRLDADTSSKLNSILMHLEPSLLRSEGLPDRPWYRHQIWAPGVNTGYSGFAFPGVHEAIVLRDWKVAQDQVKVIAATLDQFTSTLQNATAVLSTKD